MKRPREGTRLVLADGRSGTLRVVTGTGEVLGALDLEAAPPVLGPVARASDGMLLVLAARAGEVIRCSPAGAWVEALGRGHLVEGCAVAADVLGNVYVADRGAHALVKFDRRGSLVARRPISHPRTLLLSRWSSGQRYIAVTREDSTEITILLTADLSPVSSQDLGRRVEGLLNSEIVAPRLVYMTEPEAGTVHTFVDRGGRFNPHRTYRLGAGPTGIAEANEGVFVCCRDSGELWVQRAAGLEFERIAASGLGWPQSIAVVADVAPLVRAAPAPTPSTSVSTGSFAEAVTCSPPASPPGSPGPGAPVGDCSPSRRDRG